MSRVSLAVYIGRFQPFHKAHLQLVQQALEEAHHCIIVLGSAYQARTPKNPFTWIEREQMIRGAFSELQISRLSFVPVRDYFDDALWLKCIKDAVHQISLDLGLDQPLIKLIGHLKDDTSLYLQNFAPWAFQNSERIPIPNATQLRNTLFNAQPQVLGQVIQELQAYMPQSTQNFLEQWVLQPIFTKLVSEWQFLEAHKRSWANAPYKPIFVTVDALVLCAQHILLIERGRAPGKGLWALPGGYVASNETLKESVLRELLEETHLALTQDQLRYGFQKVVVFDHPNRSLLARIITHVHYFEVEGNSLPTIRSGDDAQAAFWLPLNQLCLNEEHFLDDHFAILNSFLELKMTSLT